MRNSKINENIRRSWYGKNSEVSYSALKGEVLFFIKIRIVTVITSKT